MTRLYRFVLLCSSLMLLSTTAKATVGLTMVSTNSHDVRFSYNGDTDEYTIVTTGGDPYVYISKLAADLAQDEDTLAFEYKCASGIGIFQVYFGNTYSEERSRIFGSIPASSQWRTYKVSIKSCKENFSWGKKGQACRLDWGMNSGVTITVRNLRIENADQTAYLKKVNLNRTLHEYLTTTYPNKITNVTVTKSGVVIEGTCKEGGDYKLVEIPPYGDVTIDKEYAYSEKLLDSNFRVVVMRKVRFNGVQYDRALSKWAIVDCSSGEDVLASHAHYADSITNVRRASYMPLKGKKGLGGFVMFTYSGDLDMMNIQSVTVNMLLTSLISTSPSFANSLGYTYNGRTYYIDGGYISAFDATFKYCFQRGVIVSAILLVARNAANEETTQLFRHPECNGGNYSMPNMTTLESTNLYAAIINYLANRYSQSSYGRINHWILHNEVDYGQEWTNMGEQPAMNYIDTYVKSMRLVYNIVRQYDPNASVLGSYTHSWTSNSGDGVGYNSKNMLTQTVNFSNAEGDFRWGVAYHPYPQDLTKPRFWENDTQSTYSMNSAYCTFKNLEVIHAWMMQPENFYQGKEKRICFLSENGTNSPDYSTTQLNNQAAGACWAWKKVARLKGIDAIQWHNWVDNRAEYGLRIGLRRYGDDETEPYGAKPVWYVWQAADSETEDEVFSQYMSTLGITNWESIFNEPLALVGITEATVKEAPALAVFGGKGAVINRTGLPAYVYNLSGALVSELGTYAALPAGIYIIKVGNNAKKVQVK